MSYQILDQVKKDLQELNPIFKIEGVFKLTKTQNAYAQAWIERDLEIENSVLNRLLNKIPIGLLNQRYQIFDPNFRLKQLPPHIPANVLSSSGAIGSGSNIFMFFPEVLNLPARNNSDCFGIEFVDVWVNIFEKVILPCCREVLDFHTNLDIRLHLIPKLRETIYLAAILHEIGHEVGPFKIVPTLDPKLKLKQFYIDVIGELTTDSMAILSAPEFRELSMFILLQRIFWFGRRGFKNDPNGGNINLDNDAWIGSMLWKQAINHGVILASTQNRWRIQFDCSQLMFQDILENTQLLYQEIVKTSEQNIRFHNWMQTKVDSNGKQFIIPSCLSETYSRCIHIDEEPTFRTHLSLVDMNKMEILK